MANLKDKINIDSSSSSCDANVAPSSTTPLPSTITTTSITPTMVYNNNNNNNNNYNNKTCNANNPTAGGGVGSLLDDLNLFCSADPPLPLKPISFANAFTCNVGTVATTSSDCPSYCFATTFIPATTTTTTTTCCTASLSRPHSPSSPSPPPPLPTPLLTTITTTTIITTTCATNGTPMNGDGHAAAAVGTSSVTTLQSFDDYLDLSKFLPPAIIELFAW
ncbi:probable serine/threonine-protein kinase ndrD [Ochlerotatus camptorhynchus]|uniref:probable serine/threonine-protein kinase ndrD n=1 Tax=Ochlerotatus camptorhynchus TaxID=644619 RepID=UPI0031CE8AF7